MMTQNPKERVEINRLQQMLTELLERFIPLEGKLELQKDLEKTVEQTEKQVITDLLEIFRLNKDRPIFERLLNKNVNETAKNVETEGIIGHQTEINPFIKSFLLLESTKKKIREEAFSSKEKKFKKAAEERKDVFEQFMMGMLYEDGIGVQENIEEAVRWYNYLLGKAT